MTTYLISAGDASGELHAAALVEALRERDPDARFVGLGGPEMAKAGVEIVVDQHEIAIGGLVEVFRDLGRIVSAWRRLGRCMRELRPDVVILVDAPDFNIPLARPEGALGGRRDPRPLAVGAGLVRDGRVARGGSGAGLVRSLGAARGGSGARLVRHGRAACCGRCLGAGRQE